MFKSNNTFNSLKDVYFIFADDTFVDKFEYISFASLIKFYSLLYERIIIPDSFLINNIHLHKFFMEGDGYKYLENDIISFTLREEIRDIKDLLDNYISSKTLKNNVTTDTITQIIDNYNFSNSIRWNMKSVSNNFSKNILSSYNTIELIPDENRKLEYILNELNINNQLTRKNIYDKAFESFNNINSINNITKFSDIVYNFNIPNLLNLSSAYPDRLLSNNVLSPEKVFFAANSKSADIRTQSEDLFSKHTIEILQPLIFYTKVLENLSFNDILDIRKTSEFKNFIKSLSINDSKVMMTSFHDYLKVTNTLISNRLYKFYNNIVEIDSKIQISNKIENSTQNIIGFTMNFIPLSTLINIPVSYFISKFIQITGNKARKNLSNDVKLLSIEAEMNSKKLILENPNTILNDMNSAFQINKLR